MPMKLNADLEEFSMYCPDVGHTADTELVPTGMTTSTAANMRLWDERHVILQLFRVRMDSLKADEEEGELDWLVVAEKDVEQDLDTSKKELELIRSIIEDVDGCLAAEKKPSRTLRDQKMQMGACQEYSSSRCAMLKERLRQVQFWASSRQMGRTIPEKAPGEWQTADLEWRIWLSEQTATKTDQLDQTPVSALEQTVDPENDAAWRIWGPLAHILTAYVWHNEQQYTP
ncbi:Uu.00g062140.m01.CDS01 [Anthostomella pinea]|uniref:Uu.00g062140.m01.CDS01 n=1 Tax=Anthostomella pinea TaxID=933095 RepID=A0AAI8VTW7_9PEZI|nr:Uu.00g062140.m01.CDS01 [Anthostomella pinea]